MRLTAKDSSLAVLDDVLDKERFDLFWNYFNGLDFAYRNATTWQKVWRLNDGQVVASASSYRSKGPFNSPLDWIDQTVVGLAQQHFEDIVGKEGVDWKDVIYTPYIYPTGTKISWHDDFGYTGACIFYPHQEWSPFWGGELFIAKTPPPEERQQIVLANNSKGSVSNNITREYVAPLLNTHGMGVYVAPLPNRMTFTSGSVWHAVNRVDQAAGDKVRCSIVAFFLKEKIN
jgi:hypothetical protein